MQGITENKTTFAHRVLSIYRSATLSTFHFLTSFVDGEWAAWWTGARDQIKCKGETAFWGKLPKVKEGMFEIQPRDSTGRAGKEAKAQKSERNEARRI